MKVVIKRGPYTMWAGDVGNRDAVLLSKEGMARTVTINRRLGQTVVRADTLTNVFVDGQKMDW